MLLLTRPRAEATTMAVALQAEEVPTFLEPLLTIESLLVPVADWQMIKACTGIIITSAHAVHDPALVEVVREKKLFCVGHRVAHAWAGNHPDCHVFSNSRELQEALSEQQGHWHYLRGQEITQDLSVPQGTITATICYRAIARESFSAGYIAACAGQTIKAVSFYSQRTAAIFVRLSRQENLLDYWTGKAAFCLSAKVVEVLKDLPFGAIHVCSSPDSDAMLRLIRERYP